MIRKLSFLKCVTIEPIIFLYTVGEFSTLNVCENFRLDRFCRVSLNRSEDCDNLGNGIDEELEVEVQKLENQFMVYGAYISTVLPVLILIYIASWSDKHGRMIPMVIALGGFALYFAVYLLAAIFPSWSAWVLLLAIFLGSFAGTVVNMASYAHIADITTDEDRTTRMSFLIAVRGFGGAAGTALGPIILDLKGYVAVYLVAVIIFIICMIWSYFIIPHKTYKPEDPTKIKSTSQRMMNIPRKIKQNLVELIKTAVKKREGYTRFSINYLILVNVLILNTFPERMFLWTRLVLKWDIDTFSIYSFTESILGTVVMFIATPLIAYSKLHDCIIGAIVQLILFCKTLAFGLLTNPSQWYVLYMFAWVPQSIPSVCIRSLLSKQCGPGETGRVMALLAVSTSLWPLVRSLLYGAVYAATVDTYPSAIHLVESGHSVVIFASLLGLHLLLRSQDSMTIPVNKPDAGN